MLLLLLHIFVFIFFFLPILFVFSMWAAEILRLNIKRCKGGRGGKINYVYASQTDVADYNSNTSYTISFTIQSGNTSNINIATLSRKCATTTRAGRD